MLELDYLTARVIAFVLLGPMTKVVDFSLYIYDFSILIFTVRLYVRKYFYDKRLLKIIN